MPAVPRHNAPAAAPDRAARVQGLTDLRAVFP